MDETNEIGNLDKGNETLEIEWKITDFFSTATKGKEFKSASFTFGKTSWHFRLCPKSEMEPEVLSLQLVQTGNFKRAVLYNFGLKKLDGNIDYLVKGIIHYCSNTIPWLKNEKESNALYLQQTEVSQRKSDLAPSGVLIVTCTLKCENIGFGRVSPPKFKEFIKLDTLTENFKRLFLDEKGCDTTLYVANKMYTAHRAVLMARSPVFAAMFLHDTSEKETGTVIISDCDPGSFGKFLEFLYTGKLENISCNSACDLYETSEKYDVQELKEFCTEYLIENLTLQNFCYTIVMADKYDDTRLFFAARRFFLKNASHIMVISEWEKFIKTNYSLANKFMLYMASKAEFCH